MTGGLEADIGPGQPSVSCVIPVFNGARYLLETIDSVLAQSHRPLEVIVVDDGSTDASAEMAAARRDAVRVLRQPHRGQAMARRTGIMAAHGEFVALLDADDLWHADKLARQVARFEEVPQLDVSLATSVNFWEDGLEHEEERYRAADRMQAAHHFSSILARRQLLAETLPIRGDLAYGDQLDWFLRARDAQLQIDVTPDVLVFRRMHAASTYLEVLKRQLDVRRARAT
jgi:glycosyltransferase involved in cell wall biosynthesis